MSAYDDMRAAIDSALAACAAAERKELEAQDRLVAATELLKWLASELTGAYRGQINAFLANAPAAPIRSECSECKSDWGHYAGCSNEGLVQVPTRTDHERAKPYDASFETCDCETADEHERGACRKPCTDHERAVLDACRNAVTRVAHMGQEVLQLTQGSQQTIAEAVVAWREARGESTRIHDAERALLRIVRQRCQGSRTWMQANMSDLFTADEALRNAESYK
jgi:hypothetical protein